MNTAAGTRQRVLIVDDEPSNVLVLAEVLQGAYDLSFATDPARAVELATLSRYDLVLLDVVMPGLDGYDVLERLRHTPANAGTPVIFVTAMHDTRDEERGFAAGAVDYITKPISAPIVRARVRTHLELKRQRDLLERLALQDGLTGIANRRRFDDELAARCRDAAARRDRLALLLVDVDHFKAYNDRYGHGAGDDCLRAIAHALARAFERPDELAARVGGEEFALLPSGSDARGAARRALEAVRALDLAHAGSPSASRVSISIGAIERAVEESIPPRRLMAQADGLLYEAKQSGRDRAVHLDAEGRREVLGAEGHA